MTQPNSQNTSTGLRQYGSGLSNLEAQMRAVEAWQDVPLLDCLGNPTVVVPENEGFEELEDFWTWNSKSPWLTGQNPNHGAREECVSALGFLRPLSILSGFKHWDSVAWVLFGRRASKFRSVTYQRWFYWVCCHTLSCRGSQWSVFFFLVFRNLKYFRSQKFSRPSGAILAKFDWFWFNFTMLFSL